jgi:hypothetical protein
MKTTTVHIALTGLLSGTSATCYGSGNKWATLNEAKNFVIDPCSKANGIFTGWFKLG